MPKKAAANPVPLKQDMTNLIERLELFEERLGVRLEAVSATIDQWHSIWNPSETWMQIDVTGELHPSSGMTLDKTIVLVIAVYDNSGRVIQTDSCWFLKDKFYGFDVFHRQLRLGALPGPKISKIRVYPRES